MPGPNAYDNGLSWKKNQLQFGSGPARKTFTDDAAKLSKQIPSAATYKPQYQRKLLLGHLSKTEGINYLSDPQFIAATQPGPTSYKGDVSFFSKKL